MRGVLLAALLGILIPIRPIRPAVSLPPPALAIPPAIPPGPDFRAIPGGWLLHGDRVFLSDPTHSNPPRPQP